jgi:uncharacterized protein (DUF2384 family)
LFASVLDEHFGPVLEEFDLEFEDLEDLLGPHLPWTCWGAAFEDFMTRHWDPEGNAVDIYLKRRGWREPVLAKSYMQGLRDAHVSLHDVVAINPGTGMVLRDLLTGADPVAVREKSASKSLQPGDRIAVRVVPVRDHHVISGALLPFAPAVVELLMDGLRTTLKLRRKKDLRLTPDQLRRMAPLFTAAFLFTHIPDALDPQVLQMTNTDGEALVFHELRFPFATGVTQAQVAQEVAHLPDLSSDGPKRWVWLSRPRKGMGDGGTIHGTLELRGRSLVLEVNSAERAARGAAMIGHAAGALLRPPLTAIQTFEQARAAHAGKAPAPQDDIPPDIARDVIHAHMDRHYRETLDQPVPALRGKTPRQSVKTAAGRKLVTDWLRLLESGSARPEAGPMAGYDFGWMWTELGLTRDG